MKWKSETLPDNCSTFECFSYSQQPGCLSECQGMGWYLEEANIAQVSLNLLDYRQAGMHTAFEECVNDARVWTDIISCFWSC